MRSDPRDFCTIIISGLLKLKDARVLAWLSDATLDYRRMNDEEAYETVY